jgi:formylglycine-generating enzyme required for sulfatase activity
MLRYGIFASRWPLSQQTVWTIVNRNEYDVDGPQIELPAEAGLHYYDLYHGVELSPAQNQAGRNVLSFSIEAHGYAALLASPSLPNAGIHALMVKMKDLSPQSLSSYSHEWNVLPQKIVAIAATKPPIGTPPDMVKIPEGDFQFRVQGIEIEGFNDIGVDVQYPWENAPRRFHDRPLRIKAFWIDKYPVTNAQFKKFIDAAHYNPQDDVNFLRDWQSGKYPEGWDNKPVTWV